MRRHALCALLLLASLGSQPVHAKLVTQTLTDTHAGRTCEGTLADDDALARDPRVAPQRLAAIGYCFGGSGALDVARSGAADPFVKLDELQAFVAEMEAARVDYQLVLYAGAVRAFTQREAGTDPSAGAAYNAAADRRSWAQLQAFFSEILD